MARLRWPRALASVANNERVANNAAIGVKRTLARTCLSYRLMTQSGHRRLDRHTPPLTIRSRKHGAEWIMRRIALVLVFSAGLIASALAQKTEIEAVNPKWSIFLTRAISPALHPSTRTTLRRSLQAPAS